MKFTNPEERIMVALDVDELSQAEELAQQLAGFKITFKIGNQLGTFEGWQKVIDWSHELGINIFCDTKFKDIPNTVERSARAITRLQPDFFNVMADNSPAALSGAVNGATSAQKNFDLPTKPIILGVTVLTSINNEEAGSIYGAPAQEKVTQFATAAAEANLDGVVCSAEEATLLREHEATKNLLLVTPGIRPEWAASGDQSRIITPKQAIENGADYLVIGRPITNPPAKVGTPREALMKIIEEIK